MITGPQSTPGAQGNQSCIETASAIETVEATCVALAQALPLDTTMHTCRQTCSKRLGCVNKGIATRCNCVHVRRGLSKHQTHHCVGLLLQHCAQLLKHNVLSPAPVTNHHLVPSRASVVATICKSCSCSTNAPTTQPPHVPFLRD